MEAFFEEGTKGTDKRPAPLAQRDKLRSNSWPYSTHASLSLCGDTLGRRKWVRPRFYQNQEVWGVGHGKLAALEGPSNQISTLNLLFGGQVPKPSRKHGLGQKASLERRPPALTGKGPCAPC